MLQPYYLHGYQQRINIYSDQRLVIALYSVKRYDALHSAIKFSGVAHDKIDTQKFPWAPEDGNFKEIA